jgi:hypothetical protein
VRSKGEGTWPEVGRTPFGPKTKIVGTFLVRFPATRMRGLGSRRPGHGHADRLTSVTGREWPAKPRQASGPPRQNASDGAPQPCDQNARHLGVHEAGRPPLPVFGSDERLLEPVENEPWAKNGCRIIQSGRWKYHCSTG